MILDAKQVEQVVWIILIFVLFFIFFLEREYDVGWALGEFGWSLGRGKHDMSKTYCMDKISKNKHQRHLKIFKYFPLIFLEDYKHTTANH